MSTTTRATAVRSVLVVVVAALAAACVPTPTTPSTTTTTTTTTSTTTSTTTTTAPPPDFRPTFCRIWKERHPEDATGPLPAPRPYVYELDDKAVVQGRSVEQQGVDCEDPAARIQFFDGQIVGRDLYFPVENSVDTPPIAPLPYSPTLAPGQMQAPGVEIASISIELSPAGVRVYGTLRITINGAESILKFDGTWQDLENFSVSLEADRLDIPGFTNDPLRVSGSLVRRAGINTLIFDADAPSLSVGDLAISDARIHLSATTTTGLRAEISGRVQTGASSAAIELSAAFDSQGQLMDLDGHLELDVTTVQGDGTPIALTGTVALSGRAANIEASFSGTGQLGSDVIARASGRLTIDAAGTVVVTGAFRVGTGGATLDLEGSITLTNVGGEARLSAQAAGAYVGVTPRGEIVEVRGTVTVTNTGGQLETTVAGSLRFGPYRGDATATVTSDGRTTVLDLVGRVSADPLVADVTGRIELTDGLVTSALLNGAVQGTARVGDLSLGGAVRLEVTPGGAVFDVTGSMSGPGFSLTGGALLVVDAGGRLVAVRAGVGGSVTGGSQFTLGGFSGSLAADVDSISIIGFGVLSGPGLNYGQANGSLLVTGGVASLSLQGQASITSGSKRLFGDITIIDNELTLARAGLVYPPILIDPERVWVRISLGDEGKCTRLDVLDATFLIGLFTGGQIARTDTECPA